MELRYPFKKRFVKKDLYVYSKFNIILRSALKILFSILFYWSNKHRFLLQNQKKKITLLSFFGVQFMLRMVLPCLN